MLDLNADITGLKGADYNPRRIGEADLDTLAESIRELGLLKPLIVRGDLLVAGHQRTLALRRLGMTRAAVYRLPGSTNVYDEVRFNQLHNGTDLDAGDEEAFIEGSTPIPGFHVIQPEYVRANMRGKLAVVRAEIAKLIHKYGPWGGCVSTQSGEIIHAAQYAIAAVLTRTPLTVYVVPDEKAERARELLNKRYGVFSYEHLERKTYVQSLAQPSRHREGGYKRPAGKPTRANQSALYAKVIRPTGVLADPRLRGIDFGSGHGDEAKRARAEGANLHDVELFRRTGSSMNLTLDMAGINRMITRMCSDLERHGPYDFVICDVVLSSIDSVKAETSVMTTLNALGKIGANTFFGGRAREHVDRINARTKSGRDQLRLVEFLDDDGFTALYRRGCWFYQKFHYREEAIELAQRHGFEVVKYTNHNDGMWQIHARKVADLPAVQVEAAIDFEFNMQLGERRMGRHEDVKRALGLLPPQ